MTFTYASPPSITFGDDYAPEIGYMDGLDAKQIHLSFYTPKGVAVHAWFSLEGARRMRDALDVAINNAELPADDGRDFAPEDAIPCEMNDHA